MAKKNVEDMRKSVEDMRAQLREAEKELQDVEQELKKTQNENLANFANDFAQRVISEDLTVAPYDWIEEHDGDWIKEDIPGTSVYTGRLNGVYVKGLYNRKDYDDFDTPTAVDSGNAEKVIVSYVVYASEVKDLLEKNGLAG